ncbi:multiheme c-type cytochrome [Sulfurimonas sp. HSL-1716]|uniref:multiheme c-type cytochrome n=1 Tax=Hydrocurvibacter sulfurireducens TaxID=3131937 RepID=UPI0031F7A89A
MKKILLLIMLVSSVLFAKSETQACKKCHPTIVEEFQSSLHKHASFNDDKIHKALWDRHPLHAKGKYECAKCHAPNAKNEEDMKEPFTCLSCHTITNIEHHPISDKNIYETKPKQFYSAEAGRENEKLVYKEKTSFFGLQTGTVGSPYHKIDYRNKQFYTGEICMGCHSHKQNSHQFTLCQTDKEGASSKKQNCITCHMPKIKGTATTIRISETHAFHGFAGARNNSEMLSKYVELSFEQNENGFSIGIKNRSPHDLLTHPLRVVELRVNLIRNGKTTALKSQKFLKVIGHDGKPSMPWIADKILMNTMIKADEKRTVAYTTHLQSKDTIEAELGFYIVNPKALGKLGLEKNEDAKKFTILKQKYFTVK